jgi:hypothetical protein
MKHDSVAEEKSERPGLVALQQMQIRIEFGGRIQDRRLNGWIHAVISVQNPRDRGHADLGRFSDLFETDLASSGR